jgi:hypothetical protein
LNGWHIIAIIAIGTPIAYGLIELAATRLFDHVDQDQGDETAPPRDAP